MSYINGKGVVIDIRQNDISTQARTITPSTEKKVVKPTGEYDLLSQVTVNAIQTQSKTATENGKILPDSGKYLYEVVVEVEKMPSAPAAATSEDELFPVILVDGVVAVNQSGVFRQIRCGTAGVYSFKFDLRASAAATYYDVYLSVNDTIVHTLSPSLTTEATAETILNIDVDAGDIVSLRLFPNGAVPSWATVYNNYFAAFIKHTPDTVYFADDVN